MPDRDRDLERAVVLAGHRGDVAAARAAMGAADARVRAATLGALARCGALGLADLRAALRDADAGVRRRAAEEAGRLGDPAITEALLVAVTDPDVFVVEAAAHALGELPPTAAAVDALTGLARHDEVVVRETAVAALGSLGDGAGLDAVLAATTDVATVRRRAVLALAAFEGDEVEAALGRLAEDRDRQVRQAAEDLLHGWGGGASAAP